METEWREESAVTHSNEEGSLGAGVATIEEEETAEVAAEEQEGEDEYVSAPPPVPVAEPEPVAEPVADPEPAAEPESEVATVAAGEGSYQDEDAAHASISEPSALADDGSAQRMPYKERRESLRNVDSPYKRSTLTNEVLTPEEEERRRTVAENIANYEKKIKEASEEVEAKPWLGKRGSVLSPDKK